MATYEELECHTLREAIPPMARADIAILLLELCQVETDLHHSLIKHTSHKKTLLLCYAMTSIKEIGEGD